MKNTFISAALLATVALAISLGAYADSQADILVPSSERGLHYFTNSALLKVNRLDDTAATKKEYCIPSGSTIRIGDTKNNGLIAVTVVALPTKPKGDGKVYADAPPYTATSVKKVCLNPAGAEVPWADPEYIHVVTADNLANQDYRRSGFTFGALVVPFKYYIGSDSKITSSTTIAPYVGYAFESFRGMNSALIGSAGLGLVPINDPATTTTETKPALSTAIGLLFTSRNNKNWSSGFLIGKDFVGDADKQRDPTADDPWISVFIGTPIK